VALGHRLAAIVAFDDAKCEAKYGGGVLEMKLVAKAGVEGKKLAVT
jgi:hypothetical protein